MTTSILTILPQGMGRWSPSFLAKEDSTRGINLRRERDGHLQFQYVALRGWGDDRLHLVSSSLGDGEIATPHVRVEAKEIKLRGKERERDGHIHPY